MAPCYKNPSWSSRLTGGSCSVWSANNDAAAVSHAAMLDSGNFVLVSGNSSASLEYEWQSFHNPTDTILPTQELRLGSYLISHLTENDYSDGRFKLAVQADGNLVLYLIDWQSGAQYSAYWASGTVGNGTSLVFDGAGNVFLSRRHGGFSNVTSCSACNNNNNMTTIYQRATLDSDGVFRHYYHTYMQRGEWINKETRWRGGWSLAGQIPDNICTAITSSTGGGGACGFNAYCTLDDQGSPNCQCPQGYSFLDPTREYKGCKPGFPIPVCGENGSTINGSEYELKQMIDTDWPLSDYEKYVNVDEQMCRKECLDDCFCAVVIFRGTKCWKKRFPLSNGRVDASVAGKALVKISMQNTARPPPCQVTRRRKFWGLSTLATSLLLGASAFLNVISVTSMLLFFFCCYRKRIRQRQPSQHHQQNHRQLEWRMPLGSVIRSFSLEELEESTEGFANVLGEGASGIVYKGTVLAVNSEVEIAVKRLKYLNETAEKEFIDEVTAIGQARHKNLLKMLGFCNDGHHRLLVYEFMSNGSLTNFLFRGLRLQWKHRVQIAHGIARGLLYLHEQCEIQIIHCDIKPENILLDQSLSPKICDFGVVKLLKLDQTRTMTGIRGTRGYLAPEWVKAMPITTRVDVYSFGVVLLEITCCRRNVISQSVGSGVPILTWWAYDCYKNERLNMLLPEDEGTITVDRICEKFIKVALWCIQEDLTLRPSMKKVTQMLEGSIPIPLPIPDPEFVQPNRVTSLEQRESEQSTGGDPHT